ncbi:hypothetical protein N0V90_005633 [Kalmusia sp. IMI 367209]|nr:hypothetical protein N0V90_005633 [Kalmusia sp. IMI 367209]
MQGTEPETVFACEYTIESSIVAYLDIEELGVRQGRNKRSEEAVCVAQVQEGPEVLINAQTGDDLQVELGGEVEEWGHVGVRGEHCIGNGLREDEQAVVRVLRMGADDMYDPITFNPFGPFIRFVTSKLLVTPLARLHGSTMDERSSTRAPQDHAHLKQTPDLFALLQALLASAKFTSIIIIALRSQWVLYSKLVKVPGLEEPEESVEK